MTEGYNAKNKCENGFSKLIGDEEEDRMMMAIMTIVAAAWFYCWELVNSQY